MVFVRANLIVLLMSMLFSPVFAASDFLEVNNSQIKNNNIDNSLVEGVCFEPAILSENFQAKDYCQKLNKHIAILKKFNEINKKHQIIDFVSHNNDIFNIKNIEYKNELVKICISKMVEQNSLEPFFKTWDYAYGLCISNKDIIFVREFSIVIFSLYENLLTVILNKKIVNLSEQFASEIIISDNKAIKSLLDDILMMYNAVSELPIKDIIVTLEKCYILFSKIIDDYAASSGLTPRQLIKKYWWLPPTIFVAIIGAFIAKKFSEKLVKKSENFII